ncbi:hypothetical protein A0H81_07660 [Grifola frondosa]|uniref:Uncharacterized protein n=1 Tax=Grifola frondosa TaxID=5627 RepID=A0A1C7M7A5_GRIFR|nr:hypothetical protein A0H81_07660 [Grifola frondosa]
MCGLQGFSTLNLPRIQNAILGWLSQPPTRSFIANLVAENPRLKDRPRAQAVDDILASLEVTVLDIKQKGGISTPIANVYINSPTESPESWYRWREHICDIRYTSLYDGTGTAQSNLLCTGCHGVDHPRGLCPYPSLPGWNGPTYTLADKKNAKSRGNAVVSNQAPRVRDVRPPKVGVQCAEGGSDMLNS